MGFGSKGKRGSAGGGKKSSGSKEKDYRNLGTIWQSDKFDGQYIGMQKQESDYYPGDLIFHDRQTGKYYRVKQISLFEPKETAPEAAIMNLVINLASEYQAELITEDGEEASSQDAESAEA